MLARVGIFIAMLAPFAAISMLISTNHNGYLLLFFKTLFPATAGAFSLFAFYDAICLHLGLYDSLEGYKLFQDDIESNPLMVFEMNKI